MTAEDDRYLWDGTGPPDPDVARLEALLRPLGHANHAPPALSPRGSRWRMYAALAVAAALLLAVGTSVYVVAGARAGWWVQSLSGTPDVAGVAVERSGRLRMGQWLTTDAVAQARLSIGHIGNVVVLPNSRVQLVESRGREHRIALERGTIHARIWAPPKFFFVNTPSAVAVDLGCAYSLSVDDEGRGVLRVTQGWVALEHERRESFIPQGAMCMTAPGIGPGTPRYEDAPSGYGPALATLDFGYPGDPLRSEALELVLSQARRRDALTLWHLLSRGTPAERARVFDRLAALSPPPPRATREAILAGDRAALDQWWDALGIHETGWWKLMKKKIVSVQY